MNDIAREHENALFKLVVYEAVKEKSKKYMEEAAAADIIIPYESTQQMKKVIGRKLLKRQFRCSARSTFKVLRRVTVVIAVIFTLFFGVTMSVEALRVDFTRFLLTFYPDSARVEIIEKKPNGNVIESGKSLSITNQYIPTYIPDDFVVKFIIMSDGDLDIYYENDEGQAISFAGYASGMISHINTETAEEIKTVDISGNSGMLIIKSDATTVTWEVGDVYFMLITYLDEEETLKIARSVALIE